MAHDRHACRPLNVGVEGMIKECPTCQQRWKYHQGSWRGLRGISKPTRRERKGT